MNEFNLNDTAPIEPGSAPRRRRLAAGGVFAGLLVLPLFYVALHYKPDATNTAVPLQSADAAAPNDIPALEAAAAARPSAENRIHLSQAYIEAGMPDRALPVLQSIVAEDKGNAPAWNNICVADTMLKDYKNGIAACMQAISIQPNFQLAKNNLKWASDERSKLAADLAARAQAAPATRDARFYLDEGLDQLYLGAYDPAIESWRRTLELDPKNAVAANNIGTAYMMKLQYEEATTWFKRALALDPTMQLAKNNLAWAEQEKARHPTH
ncbi:MAG: tetratricopeptide repeat protein [Candidatus Korobacteraceae bacterium]|jgi:tetratricopeptide (TPR) repeat protein